MLQWNRNQSKETTISQRLDHIDATTQASSNRNGAWWSGPLAIEMAENPASYRPKDALKSSPK
jgi:hypothetical protein